MSQERSDRMIAAIPIGTGAGVALGLVLMTILDHPGFFALGIALGMSLGAIIGLLLSQHEE